jgi:hypothetical protein
LAFGHFHHSLLCHAAMRAALLLLGIVVFLGWSVWLVHDEGLAGLFTLLRDHDWGAQVFGDLGVALLVAWSLLVGRARAHGVPVLRYLVLTPLIGSPALLACLVHIELRRR